MPFSECGEQAVGVGREQGDQGGGCVMVQEGGDGGRARVGAGRGVGFGSGSLLWYLIPSSNLLSVLGTLKVMWGPWPFCHHSPAPHTQGVQPDNLPWNPNFDP